MGVIWTSRTRARQPTATPRINWANPLARNLRVVVTPSGGANNLVIPIAQGSPAPGGIYHGQRALVWNKSGTYARLNTGVMIPTTTDHSFVALLTNTWGATSGTMGTLLSNRNGANNGFAVYLSAQNSLPNQNFQLNYVHGGIVDYFDISPYISNVNTKFVTLGFSAVQGSSVRSFAEGAFVQSKAIGTMSGNTIDPLVIGTDFGTAHGDFASPLILWWSRALSDDEMVSVQRNPWQLFSPIRTQLFFSASGGGAAALGGATTTGATATGSLSTAIPILGAAVSGATASGSLSTAISLAGATATISATATGALSATIRLAGDAVAGALAAGGLTTGIPLAGGGSVGGAGTGDLSTGSGLAGAGGAGAAGTGVLTTQITLSGAAIAQAIASGALTTTPAGLAGDGASSSSGSGALSTGIPLAGAAAVSVVGAGGLVTAIALAGAATAAVSATGDLVVSLGLAGAALISAIGSGALLASITLNGAAVTGAVGAGALSGAALHASPWRTVTSLARVRSVRATARVRRCIAGVR